MTVSPNDIEQQAQLRQSIQMVADAAAEKAVRETFQLFGVDTRDPIKAQEQFALLRKLAEPRTIKNLEWLDSVHASAERASDVSWRAIIKTLVLAALGLAGLMTKEYWINHIGWK